MGCVDRPNICHPGSADVQQRRAQRFDPFPEPDTGPEMVGARPREFQIPESEVDRARRTRPLWRGTGLPAPVPVR